MVIMSEPRQCRCGASVMHTEPGKEPTCISCRDGRRQVNDEDITMFDNALRLPLQH